MFWLQNNKKLNHNYALISEGLQQDTFNPFSAIMFCPENVICIYPELFQTYFINEANTMNLDQTAPQRKVWSGCILFAM